MKPDQVRVGGLIMSTILKLCEKGLNYQDNVKIEAVVGITIDSVDVFYIHIDKSVPLVNNEDGSSTNATSTSTNYISSSSAFNEPTSSNRDGSISVGSTNSDSTITDGNIFGDVKIKEENELCSGPTIMLEDNAGFDVVNVAPKTEITNENVSTSGATINNNNNKNNGAASDSPPPLIDVKMEANFITKSSSNIDIDIPLLESEVIDINSDDEDQDKTLELNLERSLAEESTVHTQQQQQQQLFQQQQQQPQSSYNMLQSQPSYQGHDINNTATLQHSLTSDVSMDPQQCQPQQYQQQLQIINNSNNNNSNASLYKSCPQLQQQLQQHLQKQPQPGPSTPQKQVRMINSPGKFQNPQQMQQHMSWQQQPMNQQPQRMKSPVMQRSASQSQSMALVPLQAASGQQMFQQQQHYRQQLNMNPNQRLASPPPQRQSFQPHQPRYPIQQPQQLQQQFMQPNSSRPPTGNPSARARGSRGMVARGRMSSRGVGGRGMMMSRGGGGGRGGGRGNVNAINEVVQCQSGDGFSFNKQMTVLSQFGCNLCGKVYKNQRSVLHHQSQVHGRPKKSRKKKTTGSFDEDDDDGTGFDTACSEDYGDTDYGGDEMMEEGEDYEEGEEYDDGQW